MASNKNVVPQAREALDKFKMEAASEKGVPLDIKVRKPLIIKAF
ncbi:MAG: small, acid-soluble spore protein, alpha/beta type [Ruminococcus sp.]|nr:small, acid-soluble spore protein, alpha/beta type [Candidatus Copronaster equi]